MYTRSYYQDNGSVPKDYDGNAFRMDDTPTVVTPTYGETKVSPEYTAVEDAESFMEETSECSNGEKNESEGVFSRLFSRIPFKKLPFGLNDAFGRFGKIDKEDIMIIAVALLLLFSGEGDKLFGIALLALLFV